MVRQRFGDFGGRRGNADPRRLEGCDFVARPALSARDDRSGVTHAFARRGVLTGDEGSDGLAHLVADALRRGLVSMSHGYGLDLERLGPDGDPGAPQPYSMGNHTGALASADLDYMEPYTGIPRMSSIPVHVNAHKS